MNRRQFLPVLSAGGLSLAAGAPNSARRSFELSYEVSAAPDVVFPLLCPVREYEWLDGWACEMLYSQSGVAELGCVFRTRFSDMPETWHVNIYEPPRKIEYLVMAPDALITRLTISLERIPASRTRLTWRRVFTSLSPAGKARAEAWTAEREATLGRRLEHFLKTGTMLRQGPA